MSNLEGTYIGHSGKDGKSSTDSYVMAPDFSVTITQADSVKALESLYTVYGSEWKTMDRLQQMLTMASALSVAMGHDADWALRMLANPYFVTAAKVLAEEFTSLFEQGLLS